jgi:hypothetical protein
VGGLGYLSPTYNRIRLGSNPRLRIMAKRVIDDIDIQAEREGSAVVRHNKTICKPFGMGKTITKQRKMHADGEAYIERKTIKQSFSRICYA